MLRTLFRSCSLPTSEFCWLRPPKRRQDRRGVFLTSHDIPWNTLRHCPRRTKSHHEHVLAIVVTRSHAARRDGRSGMTRRGLGRGRRGYGRRRSGGFAERAHHDRRMSGEKRKYDPFQLEQAARGHMTRSRTSRAALPRAVRPKFAGVYNINSNWERDH